MKYEWGYVPIPPDFDPPVSEHDITEAEREVMEHFAKAIGVAESSLLYGTGVAFTTSAAPAVPPLTIDTLKKTCDEMDRIMNTVKDIKDLELSRDHIPWAGNVPHLFGPVNMSNPFGIGSIPVYTSPYIGDQVTPQPPAMKKGPYYQRRILRWKRAHPLYVKANGKFFIIDNREVWCHPDDLRLFGKHVDPSRLVRTNGGLK